MSSNTKQSYVDVHTHLTHRDFDSDREEVLNKLSKMNFHAIVVNGLEPKSNRQILEMAKRWSFLRPALGIYPIHAVNHLLPQDFSLKIERFDVDAEIAFIRQQAEAGQLTAVGECGLDGYWVDESFFAEQERVFESLIDIAKQNNLPLIIHTRKLERRSQEILAHHKVEKVNFHCFGGRTKHAQRWAEEFGWWFSIPANSRKNESFAKMLRTLPIEKILTETDAPYLAPERGTRNDPSNVPDTIQHLAEARSLSHEQAAEQVLKNYRTLFENSNLCT